MDVKELNAKLDPYLLDPSDLPGEGADLRVRPEPHRPKV